MSVLALHVVAALAWPESLAGLEAMAMRPIPPEQPGDDQSVAPFNTELVEAAAVNAMMCLHTKDADAAVQQIAQNHPDRAVRQQAAIPARASSSAHCGRDASRAHGVIAKQ